MADSRMSKSELKMADSLLRKLVKAEDSAVQLHLYMYCNDRNEDHQRQVRQIKHKISETICELEQLINNNSMEEEGCGGDELDRQDSGSSASG